MSAFLGMAKDNTIVYSFCQITDRRGYGNLEYFYVYSRLWEYIPKSPIA